MLKRFFTLCAKVFQKRDMDRRVSVPQDRRDRRVASHEERAQQADQMFIVEYQKRLHDQRARLNVLEWQADVEGRRSGRKEEP